MAKDKLELIEEYYAAMGKKDTKGMEKFLHPDVVCIGPLAEAKGRDQVLAGVQRLAKYYTKLTLRSKFASNNQVAAFYDLDLPQPMGRLPTAALFTFKDDQIVFLELLYDGRVFESKMEELFPQALHKAKP